jgi:2-dehydro-3-deoxygluconokinase
VGDDSIGRRVIRDLRGEGVDILATVDPSATTGLMLKESPRSGSTTVTYYRAGSAGSHLSPDDLDHVTFEAGDLLHLTGITLAISQTARRTAFEAVTRAKAAGATISFDVNHRSRLWTVSEAVPLYRELAASADIIFAGDDEALLVTGASALSSTQQLAESLAALGPSEVVLKHGALGATTWREGALETVTAVTVAVVDTVGAGDAFVAGYLAELFVGSPVEKRLETAAITGAFACRHPGDWQGAARRADLASIGADPVSR